MSRIKGKDTGIEKALCAALWDKGVRYRKNVNSLPGSPDIAFTRQKLTVFYDSEFWHGKDWGNLRPRLLAGANPGYWIPKIERKIVRAMRWA